MNTITIEPTFHAWRDAARELLNRRVPPEQVLWNNARGGANALPFDPVIRREQCHPEPSAAKDLGQRALTDPRDPSRRTARDDGTRGETSAVRVPRAFIESCKLVACFRNPTRWTLMYRLLWRLTHGEPHLLDVLVDDDVRLFTSMEHAVERDRHKMTAFVRFRRVGAG